MHLNEKRTTTMNDKIYEIALQSIPGIGPVSIKNLLSDFGSAKELLTTDYKELINHGIRKNLVSELCDHSYLEKAEQEYNICKKKGIEILFYQDEKYPQRLNFQDQVPPLLYYKGNANLNHQKIVAIVGTREPSKLGLLECEKIVSELAKWDCLIVSGLAYGVDVKAHKSAIQSKLPTVGVMAHGMGQMYPADHRSIAKEMITNGGLLTEYTYNVEAEREYFPMRNKIVAAMSDVIIVIESGAKGGSLITAEFANAMGKDVFALPGRVSDKTSAGCNKIIKQHKAHLMESVEDVKYIMRWDDKPKVIQQKLFEDLTKNELEVLNFIKHNSECHIDIIGQTLEMNHGELMTQILQLELKGLIKSLPGKHFISNG